MFQGIASSTRRTYSSAQRKFLEFCHWSQSVHPNGPPLPATEWTLMLFASHLSNTIKASSIKVYLAAIRSLHLENGFPNPLANCLRLERVIRGIKRCQGTSKRERLPVTVAVLLRIREILNFQCYADILLWAACCTGFFGFLRSGEFTTQSAKFDARVPWVKFSKTDPSCQGDTICLGVSGNIICPVLSLLRYLHIRGGDPGPLFRHTNGVSLTRATLTTWLRTAVSRAGIEGNFLATA